MKITDEMAARLDAQVLRRRQLSNLESRIETLTDQIDRVIDANIPIEIWIREGGDSKWAAIDTLKGLVRREKELKERRADLLEQKGLFDSGEILACVDCKEFVVVKELTDPRARDWYRNEEGWHCTSCQNFIPCIRCQVECEEPEEGHLLPPNCPFWDSRPDSQPPPGDTRESE